MLLLNYSINGFVESNCYTISTIIYLIKYKLHFIRFLLNTFILFIVILYKIYSLLMIFPHMISMASTSISANSID